MLKTVKNDTAGSGYCGPVVVAAITGKPMSKVLDAFREYRHGAKWRGQYDRAPNIKGTYINEVSGVLNMFGYLMVSEQVEKVRSVEEACKMEAAAKEAEGVLSVSLGLFLTDKQMRLRRRPRVRASTLLKPTLAAWLKKRTKEQRQAIYVLIVANHWIVVRGRKLCDTFTKGEPVFIGKAPHRRKRVRRAFRVERRAA